MASLVKEVCVLSILFGIVLSLSPEGNVKKITNILCSVILISVLISPIIDFDYKNYSLELTKYRDREREFLQNSIEQNKNINRSVIEQECQTYILDKAQQLNIYDAEPKVTVQWSTEGFWLPYAVEIKHEYCSELAELIEADLGIPQTRQHWY